MIGGLFPSTRLLAVSSPEYAPVPFTQYWNVIANQLAESLIARGRLGSATVYVDKKHAASGVARYLEKQLSVSLKKSGVNVTAPTNAFNMIELDVDVRTRSNGRGTVYAEGGDIDQLWEIKEFGPVYSDQLDHLKIDPLTMNRPITVNPISDTDTEVIITARVMDRGWILVSQTYAFYFSAERAGLEYNPLYNGLTRAEAFYANSDALFIEHQNQQGGFIDHQKKLDNHIQQLIDSYNLDVDF
ncbi:hypothetical protein ACTL6P_19085 [Endozoicomonas acroporae]|uniref:hypothetical protein n=1 Tax=Endozoicomonas acroporae TaxID=1701104 RepID=UPI000C78A657|nr:hypothetical protein [Endozoicomonas acroporae]